MPNFTLPEGPMDRWFVGEIIFNQPLPQAVPGDSGTLLFLFLREGSETFPESFSLLREDAHRLRLDHAFRWGVAPMDPKQPGKLSVACRYDGSVTVISGSVAYLRWCPEAPIDQGGLQFAAIQAALCKVVTTPEPRIVQL